ncbi:MULTISPECIES: 5-oxoprolinase subunit B family protein [Streptosporangium]|uniref:KipI family sensor histidine kinase inhibitor n=1 Tax=Streptosporangium brasiliense TaxID=47480 RepID=A0ABT9RAP7_9ACTN|nr:carboxyltransferase domain-containing protein [Streptosporangium brasiliense]MDP9866325.1 KipI family sensor histidine kinase inhibitor [Streptosporangium brasiliense]
MTGGPLPRHGPGDARPAQAPEHRPPAGPERAHPGDARPAETPEHRPEGAGAPLGADETHGQSASLPAETPAETPAGGARGRGEPIRRAGEHALLVETGSLEVSHRLDALLREGRPAGVVEIVPGPATVLVVAPGADLSRLRSRLSLLLGTAREAGAGSPAARRTVTVPVVYDGADLDDVAALSGLSAGEVVERHTRRELVVGWLGFAPGFAYLTGLDPVLHVPRLPTPRTSVPAGSVAIAGPYSAVYPSASPGGWRLLGRSLMAVWDVSADPPAVLTPGTRVRFQAVTGP